MSTRVYTHPVEQTRWQPDATPDGSHDPWDSYLTLQDKWIYVFQQIATDPIVWYKEYHVSASGQIHEAHLVRPVIRRAGLAVDGGGDPAQVRPGGDAVVDADVPQAGLGEPTGEDGVVDHPPDRRHHRADEGVAVGDGQPGVGHVVGAVAEELRDTAVEEHAVVAEFDGLGIAGRPRRVGQEPR